MSDTDSVTGEIMYVQYMRRTSDNQHHLSDSKKLLIAEDVTLASVLQLITSTSPCHLINIC